VGGGALVQAPPPMPRLDDRQLARCVQALKERERSVVVMTFYDEQTAAETAGFLGISEANVRAIHQRGPCSGATAGRPHTPTGTPIVRVPLTPSSSWTTGSRTCPRRPKRLSRN